MFKLRQIISHVHSEPRCVMLWISQAQGAVLSYLVVSEWMVECVCVCVGCVCEHEGIYQKCPPFPWLVSWRWPGLLPWSFPSAQKKRRVVMQGSSQVGICRSAWWCQTACCWQRVLARPTLEVNGWNFKKQSRHALCLPSSGPTTSEPRCVRRKVFPSWWSCCAPTLTRWSELWPSPCATCPSTAATRTWSVQTISNTTFKVLSKGILFQIETNNSGSLLFFHGHCNNNNWWRSMTKTIWLNFMAF